AKLRALGYVETVTDARTLLGPAGTRFRGHQFRYSELTPPLESPAVNLVYGVRRRRGDETFREGYSAYNVLATYVHAHFASNPDIAASLVLACAEFAKARAR